MREFSSFGEFAEFLLRNAVIEPVAMKHGLEKSVDLIVKDAKEQIGVYQPKVGEFEAWAELADSTKADRLRQGFPENEPLDRTGELRESISGEVKGLEAVAGSTSQIAVYQELGTVSRGDEGGVIGEHIPPRAFLGSAGFRNAKRVVKFIGEAYAEMWLAGSRLRLGNDSE